MKSAPVLSRSVLLIVVLWLLLTAGECPWFKKKDKDKDVPVTTTEECKCEPSDLFRDLAYHPTIETVPSPIEEGCPFEIKWRICYMANACEGASPTPSGPFRERVTIKNTVPSLPDIVMEFERESMEDGDCNTWVATHTGVELPLLMIDIEWEPIEGERIDCRGDSDVEVFLNNEIHLQDDIACPCDTHESYDMEIRRGPEYDSTSGDIVWRAYFPWKQCKDNEAEIREFEELVTIVRASDGDTIERRSTYSVRMGSWLDRDYDTAALIAGETYTVTVEISEEACSCITEGLELNNRGTLEFTL